MSEAKHTPTIDLPAHNAVWEKHTDGENMTPLEVFIRDNEPCAPEDQIWRDQLTAILVADKVKIDMLVEALQPFANFACDVDLDDHCYCHNCRARDLIAAAEVEA